MFAGFAKLKRSDRKQYEGKNVPVKICVSYGKTRHMVV